MDPKQVDHLRMESTQSTDSFTTLNGSPRTSTFSGSIPPTIPESHPARTLVVCFDGTGDQFDLDNSNVVEFFSLLKKDDPSKQMVYYQAGIGTYTIPQIITPLLAKFSKALDSAFGWHLDAHIMGGYEFLMQNYAYGDRICIFGFSRGAYTARCLAGMLHKVGLLPICNHQQVPFAYKMYTRNDEEGWRQSNAFKKAFSTDVDIEFLGLWDSVSSVGLIPRYLPFASSNSVVCKFRHALALDERRARFKPNQHHRATEEEKLHGITEQIIAQKTAGKPQGKLSKFELKYGKDRGTPTDVKEVWFAGCHCDVGGGSVANGTRPCLARIPLRWMIRECFKTNSGILFQTESMKEIGLDPATLYPVVLTRPPAIAINSSPSPKMYIANIPKKGPPIITDDAANAKPTGEEPDRTEEEIEVADALAPVYDQLSIKKYWWFLEIIPLLHRYQRDDDKWASWFGWNLGRGRNIAKVADGVNLHRSVKMRMDTAYKNGRKYLPKAANLDMKKVTWVD